jgi:hypothetical protein
MPKREAPESAIVRYFTETPIEVAQAVFGIVKGVMKSRGPQPMGLTKPRAKKKVNSGGVNKQTEFPGEVAEG